MFGFLIKPVKFVDEQDEVDLGDPPAHQLLALGQQLLLGVVARSPRSTA